jgi:hypothetical protein
LALRIRDWDKHFENAASRKLKRLDWISVPNKTDGEGYMALVDHPDGAAHLGAWYAIVECASRQKVRGNLPPGLSQESGGICRDIGGTCRALGKISQLPERVFLDVIPRLLKIGWLEEYLDENQSVASSPTSLADFPNDLGKNQAHREGNGMEGNGREGNGRTHTGNGAVAPTVRAKVDRFAEFIAPWPRVANPDHAARAWLSCVDTPADEGLAFAARDRYLASDEVSRGVVTDPAKWLMDQKSAKWGGKWPQAVTRVNSKPSTAERVLVKMQQRIANGEKPL